MELTPITSRQNATLKHLARLAREKKYRMTTGEMVCEGEKMLEEALQSGVQIKTILICEAVQLSPLLIHAQQQGASLFVTSAALFASVSDVQTPQGILFACAHPMHKDLQTVRNAILLDGIQDPGNLGTILRTADAFALDAVILCEGCTDPTAPKVVRATMGAIFRQAIYQMKLADAVHILQVQKIPVYAAALDDASIPLDKFSKNVAVIIGNEGKGVSAKALALCDQKVMIPMTGAAESLNAGVAAAIFIWEMAKGG